MAEKWEKRAKIVVGVLILALSVAAVTAIIIDAKDRNDDDHEDHKCDDDPVLLDYDFVLGGIFALIYLAVCFSLCFKGKRKVFCSPLIHLYRRIMSSAASQAASRN